MLQDLSSVSAPRLKSFLDSFDTVLCDCDGVLYTSTTPVPGAKETIAKLRECGKQIRFVSNNSSTGMERFLKRLVSFELGAQKDDIAYPSMAIISYLRRIQFKKEIFVLANTITKKEISDAGFIVASLESDKLEESFADIAKNFEDNENIGAVVFDFDLNLNYAKLMKAFVYLQRPEVLYITAATDKTIPFGLKVPLMGPGAFQDTLTNFTKRTPLQFGKPALNFNKYITEKFCIQDPSRTLFVGDSLEQDIEFATRSGYQKLLTLTGLTSLKQAKECANADRIPDFYINSFGDLHKLIKNKLSI